MGFHKLLYFAQLMQDTTRLVKRSQLKRSQYKILGKPQGSCDASHDAHLRDYDEEIFDDSDFYHQVNITMRCYGWL